MTKRYAANQPNRVVYVNWKAACAGAGDGRQRQAQDGGRDVEGRTGRRERKDGCLLGPAAGIEHLERVVCVGCGPVGARWKRSAG